MTTVSVLLVTTLFVVIGRILVNHGARFSGHLIQIAAAFALALYIFYPAAVTALVALTGITT